MTNERMRVQARVLLVGKSGIGRMLLAFTVLLRFLVRILTVLVVVEFASLAGGTGGRVIIVLSVFAVVSGVLLCECARTVRDRWYFAVSEGGFASVTGLIVRFNFSDVVMSLKSGIAARMYALLRAMTYFAFPLAFTAFVFVVASRGASYAVLGVLSAGAALLILCGCFFAAVSLECVSLARTLCCYGTKSFKASLAALDSSASALFGYSVSLGFLNSAYRRTAKLLFARSVVG